MKIRARLFIAGIAATAGIVLLGGAPPARAASIGCGTTVTADTTLTSDLKCSGDALTVVPGIRLNLGGHTIKGDGTGTAIRVLAEPAQSNTTITNGRVSGFADGIVHTPDFAGTDYPTLTVNRVTLVAAPIRVEATELRITRSDLRDSGIHAWSSNVTAVRSSLVRSTATGEMLRLVLRHSHVIGGSWGADENEQIVISDSILDGTGATRSATVCFGSCTITDSVVRAYAQPIWGGPVQVKGSSFIGNSGGAIAAEGESNVTSSIFVGNGGVALQVWGGPSTIGDNRFSRNQAGLVVSGAEGVTVIGNTFRNNLGDGARSESAGTRFADNTAVGNDGWGIHAPDAVDGGGNVARKNLAGNCFGLNCTAN